MSLTADASHFNCTRGTVEIFNSDLNRWATTRRTFIQCIGFLKKSTATLDPRVRKRFVVPRAAAFRTQSWRHLEIPSPYNYMRPETYVKIANVAQSADKKRLLVEIAGDLPEQLTVGMPLSVKEYRPKVRIRNCTVNNVRPRGFLIQTTDALVRNCFFKNTMAMAILIEADMDYWGESAASDKILRSPTARLKTSIRGDATGKSLSSLPALQAGTAF
jgi:hypothetical protein